MAAIEILIISSEAFGSSRPKLENLAQIPSGLSAIGLVMGNIGTTALTLGSTGLHLNQKILRVGPKGGRHRESGIINNADQDQFGVKAIWASLTIAGTAMK
jgi:hypothetical protein